MASKNLYTVVLVDEHKGHCERIVAARTVEEAIRLAKTDVQYGALTETASVVKTGTVIVDGD